MKPDSIVISLIMPGHSQYSGYPRITGHLNTENIIKYVKVDKYSLIKRTFDAILRHTTISKWTNSEVAYMEWSAINISNVRPVSL